MWVDGKLRSIFVSRHAIAAFLAATPSRAVPVSDQDRREFVRNHLRLLAAAAADALKEIDPNADSVAIDAGLLRRHDRESIG